MRNGGAQPQDGQITRHPFEPLLLGKGKIWVHLNSRDLAIRFGLPILPTGPKFQIINVHAGSGLRIKNTMRSCQHMQLSDQCGGAKPAACHIEPPDSGPLPIHICCRGGS